MVKPETDGGGVTTIAPQPELTTGAGGAGGKITTNTVLLTPQIPVSVVPAPVVPQAAVSIYLAVMLWHPGVVGIVGVVLYAPPFILY